MSVRLIDSLATTEALADLFSNASLLQAMLDVEAALARAAARAGAIPADAAEAIAGAARAGGFDAAAIARDTSQSGTPTIPLVAALRAQVRSVDPASAEYVHWAATSQDISDTALIVLLSRARSIVAADHTRLYRTLRELSEAHAKTVMLGRTLLQPATPITFGLKVANWCAPIERSWTRLAAAWSDSLVVQFGGAAGTRAAAGERGAEVAEGLASELGLAVAPPWHSDRDRLGALAAACGLYVAALGKAARDIALLMQAEVGEVAERGGSSSSMPHKRNPSGCAVVVAAATRMPGLVSSFLSGMLQEHERGLGGWHAEWPVIAGAVQTAGIAAAALAAVVEGLTVDTARMKQNLERTRGVIYAERTIVLLAPLIGRDKAQEIVANAVRGSRESGQSFGDILRGVPDVRSVLPEDTLRDIDRPEDYLGDAETLRRQLLQIRGSSA